jgi:hypothetical protein
MACRKLSLPPYHPSFSHQPGFSIWFPGVSLVGRAYPTAFELCTPNLAEYTVSCRIIILEQGPVDGWTVFVDALHRKVVVEGRSSAGFFRYSIDVEEDGINFHAVKRSMCIEVHGKRQEVAKGSKYSVMRLPTEACSFPMPRLLLGCNKPACWERISLSPNMSEVLSLWYNVAPPTTMHHSETLLGKISLAVESCDLQILQKFHQFFTAAIVDYFVPKKTDDRFLGLIPFLPDDMPINAVHGCVVFAIRSLFIQETSKHITFLPSLPKEFQSGRLLRERIRGGHLVDLEWRKGKLRRLRIDACCNDTIFVSSHSNFECRLSSRHNSQRGKYCSGNELVLTAGEQYLLDNFASC